MKPNFNLRTKKSSTEVPVRMVIRWSEYRLVYPTQEKIKPAMWSDKDQRARKSSIFQHSIYSKYEAFNISLDRIEAAAKNVMTEWTKNEAETITPEEFKESLDIKLGRRQAGASTFMEFLKEFSDLGVKRISDTTHAHVRYNTAKQFKQLYNIMTGYRKIKKLSFRDFEAKKYKISFQELRDYMTDVKKYAANTIAGHVKNLKIVLDAARERKLLNSDDYRKFTFSFEEVETVALSPDELESIFNLDLSFRPALEKQRDLFIVQSWTALRYSDVIRIKPQHIDEKFITLNNTVKTDQKVIIPIVWQTRAIFEKYQYNLPQALSNQKYNASIKEFTKMVPELHKPIEITKTIAGKRVTTNIPKWQLVSSHTCRRSGCTNFYKMGIPASMIMRISGHASEKNFFKYIKITKEEAAEMMYKQLNQTMLKAV